MRARLHISRAITLEPSLAGALHLTTLAGAHRRRRRNADITRVDPALEAAVQLDVALGRTFSIGARAGSFWSTWQEYDVDNRAALTLSPVQPSFGLVFGATLGR